MRPPKCEMLRCAEDLKTFPVPTLRILVSPQRSHFFSASGTGSVLSSVTTRSARRRACSVRRSATSAGVFGGRAILGILPHLFGAPCEGASEHLHLGFHHFELGAEVLGVVPIATSPSAKPSAEPSAKPNDPLF